MAEESVDLPVTPEETISCGADLRRHSTGKASSGNNEEKVVPHYLRASTGSCHDICKYGRKHAFEAKERRSIPKRAARKALHQSSEESVGGLMTLVPKPRASVHSVDSKPTKMSVVQHRESVDSELQISDTSEATKQELPTKSSDSQKQIGNEVLVNSNKTSLVKVKPSLLPKSHISSIPKTRRREMSSTFKVETSSKSTFKNVKTSSKSTCWNEEAPSKLTSERVQTHSKSTSQLVKTSSKSTSKKMETSSKLSSLKGKEMGLSEKRVTYLNPTSVEMQTVSCINSSEGFGGQRNSELKMGKREASCIVASPMRASLSTKPSLKRIASINARKHKSLKIVSQFKNQPKPRIVEPEEHNNEVEEKTLYVIKVESENQTLQSDQNARQDIESSLFQLSSPEFSSSSLSKSSSQGDQEKSKYATREFEEDSFSANHEIEYMGNGKTTEVEENGKPRKDGIVYCEDKDSQMLKLKFMREKLAETQIEKSSPRRLKFRRGKVLGDNATYVKAGSDNIGVTTGPEKVVLRHQDVKGKKDGQGLFNNVIEETASRLVETQKSKVKALVGAFETVISLQEKRHSANAVS